MCSFNLFHIQKGPNWLKNCTDRSLQACLNKEGISLQKTHCKSSAFNFLLIYLVIKRLHYLLVFLLNFMCVYSKKSFPKLQNYNSYTHTHTHTHIYIYTLIFFIFHLIYQWYFSFNIPVSKNCASL
jgi:hypothetical protein